MASEFRAIRGLQSLPGRLRRWRKRARAAAAACGGGSDCSAARFEALEPRLFLSVTGQATLTTTMATWVSEANPDTNYGSQTTLLTGSDATQSKGAEFTYVAFDLSALPADVQITAATLRMDCTAVTGTSQGVQVYAAYYSWDESALTWSNHDENVCGINQAAWTVATIGTATGWNTWDVTAAATRWQNGDWLNNGFLLFPMYSGNGKQQAFASDDDPTAANRPQLVVDYVVNKPAVLGFALDSGSAVANSPVVTLDGSYSNYPTEYQASEYADFHDATWQSLLRDDSPSFTLSSGNGQHTVYLKVRNSAGESDTVKSDSIDLEASIPDLYVSQIGTASDRPPAGGTVSVTVRVSNAGLSASSPSTATIYWSADDTIDAGDQALLNVPIPAIGPNNAYYEVTVDVPVPAVVRAGDTYYMGAIADTSNTSGQQDRTDDASLPLAVQPLGVWIDTTDIWSSDERPRANEWVTLTVPVRNDGGATDTVVSLSLLDSTFTWPAQTPSDGRLVFASTAVGQNQTLHFAGSGTLDATFHLMIPAGAPDGQYVVVAAASDQPPSQPGAFVFDTTGPAESAADWTADAYVDGLTVDAGGYRVFDQWGGMWQDAEKDAPPSDGDQMCWAAASADVLAWTRWNAHGGMTTADEIFRYFQDHWSDLGGDPSCAWQYWFDGTNPQAGNASFSQIDTFPPGGGFYPTLDVADYILRQDYGAEHPLSNVMADAYSYLTQDAGVSISVDYDGSHGHSITLWGVNTYTGGGAASDPANPAHYTGIWVTDSDDDKTQPDGSTARDRLRYYSLTWSAQDGRYYVEDYSDTYTYYITGTIGLKAAPNQAPTVSTFDKSLDQDTTLSLDAADFGSALSDPDAGDSLGAVRITSLPANGSLTVDGLAVVQGQSIPIDELAGLVYTPTPSYYGADSFGWSGSDGYLYADTAAEVHLAVHHTGPDTIPPTVAIAPVTPGLRHTALDSLTITFTKPVTGFGLEDLALSHDGTDVPLGAASLGSTDGGRTWTLAGLTGLTGTAGSYTLTLTAAGSQIADAFSNLLAEGASRTWAANSAPALNAVGSMWLTSIQEDATPGTGTLVSAILASAAGDPITDSDAGALEGIAVLGVDNSNGLWQYSTNGTNWSTFGSIPENTGRLLAATDRVRFLPAPEYNGTVSAGLTFCAWDQTAGTDGQTADLSGVGAAGGITAFSVSTATAGIAIGAVNDRPSVGGRSVADDLGRPMDLVLSAGDVETAYADLTFHVPARAGHGTLTQTAHGTFRYQPDAGFVGQDSFQFTVTDNGDQPGTHGGGGDLTSAPATVTIQVGWEVAFDANNVGTFRDANHEWVKIALTGGGTGKLQFAHLPDPDGGLDAGLVVLTGTGPTSALTITTTGAGSATTIGGVLVLSGSLGTITGKTTSLNGAIAVPGLLGAVTLDDALAGSSIDVDSAGVVLGTTQLSLTFDHVTDTSVDTHAEPIKAITVSDWANTAASPVEQIAASWIGTITTLGRKANTKVVPAVTALAGDFSVDMVVSDAGAPAKTLALGTVKIAGGVSGTSWDVSGDVGPITIAGTAEDWTLQGAETDGAGLRTVKTLTLAGVQNATVLADGALGAVRALYWDRGAITADSLTSLTITGRKAVAGVVALPGDFRNADLTLRANATPAVGKATITALGSASIAGGLANSAWSVDMDAGAIKVTGDVTGWTLGSAGDNDQTDLTSVKSLTLGNVASASVTVGGVLGAVKALRWATGTIQAQSLTSMAISGRKAAGTVPEVLGDFGADVTLIGGDPAAKKPAAGAVTIAHDLSASVWLVTGSMASFAVTHTALNSTVRATGSIASITLGSGNGDRFLAGVITGQLDAASVHPADLETSGLATIGSVTVKGWTVPAGTSAPDFLTATSFLAPCLGTVSVLNGDGSWDVRALTNAGLLRIKSVAAKNNQLPKVPAKTWTWTPARNAPANAGGAAKPIV
jgi:hypothetical protein